MTTPQSDAKSLIATEDGPQLVPTQPEFAGEGDTLINVSHSSVNYKDGMALEGSAGIIRHYPTVAGIDAVGTLESGELVTVNGWGIGERRHGGYTQTLKIDSTKITRVPDRFDAWTTAAIGTAGYTAALAVAGYERFSPDKDGPVLVTGATGGVGSVTIQLLADRGYEVVALTGRVDEYADYLRDLGATDVLDRAEFSEPGKPLQKVRFAGALDAVGSVPLANVLAQVRWGGTVTACGRAAGGDLPTTVMPFILRGVNLVGINSVDAPAPFRDEAWQLLAESLDVQKLKAYTETVGLDGVQEVGAGLLAGTRHGRTVVEVS
ncbi:acryloyl-CoA reductase [Corynebacterium aquatimens]|uniref:YhdH/YhfP family quinone oxidoreductase n=1 Tax=Corynebacterium aquatimens TaxID=1190508 RepID=A0A931E5E4_9CORY|nr:acryloyl-CoA reductase [Corynebacterium aquatimens]MBG6122748.1 putative YhdH/YhfP family quinone oxidoreductase [Corynebacterium aquatimens]WJY66915.1 Acrylyl-CoA reductase AcuI [Corynebacterium aquatimens]